MAHATPPRPGGAGSLEALGWPVERLAEAIEGAARARGYPCREGRVCPPPPATVRDDDDALGRWVEAVGRWVGLDVDPVEMAYPDVDRILHKAGPALLRTPGGDANDPRFLVLLDGTERELVVLSPDGSRARVPVDVVRSAWCAQLEAPLAPTVERWLETTRVAASRRDLVRRALLRVPLETARVGGAWLVRLPPGAPLWRHALAERLHLRAAGVVAAQAVQMVVGLGAWLMLGRGALSGTLEAPWLYAWALLLASAIPFRLLTTWLGGRLAIEGGKLMKRRLLAGALRLDKDVVRREGSGQLFGRAMESAAIEAMALGGGVGAVLSLVEFAGVLFVMSSGGGGPSHASLLLVGTALSLVVGFVGYRRAVRWTAVRREMTNHLVEQMVAHRTRLAQQVPGRWHDGEDELLERYMGQSRAMDRQELLLATIPHAWLALAIVALTPTFVAGGSSATLALSLGGVLLGAQSLGKLTGGMAQVAAAWIAWKQVGPIYRAAEHADAPGSPAFEVPHPAAADGRARHQRPVVLEATGVTFTYPGRPVPAVSSASLSIRQGDRVLLEGPSGGGKSTLATVLASLGRPSSGLVLLDGIDVHSLGADAWRRRVVYAPQYQDNHVLTETLAFNLLMGRRWPPTQRDLREAEAVCDELGLGDLVARMPGGLMQMVGEGGWRLSHGERSRVFIARALLQDAKVVVLDESFGALDPETMSRCIESVFSRAPTLVVIAHP